MRTMISLLSWLAGICFFIISFVILVFCLALLPRKTTFGTARHLFRILIHIMGVRLKVKGQSHIDPNQTYLIMGNHQSLFDLFVIPSAIPLVFTGVEAAYHFSIPIWGYLIRKWGCIPIERGNLAQAKQSLELARQTLAGGLSIAILPEGHRTRTGRMGPFKKGPFHLAKATRATILPFGIHGLYEFQKRGGFHIRPGRVTVTIGEPIPWEAYKQLSVEELREKIFDQIRTLAREAIE